MRYLVSIQTELLEKGCSRISFLEPNCSDIVSSQMTQEWLCLGTSLNSVVFARLKKHQLWNKITDIWKCTIYTLLLVSKAYTVPARCLWSDRKSVCFKTGKRFQPSLEWYCRDGWKHEGFCNLVAWVRIMLRRFMQWTDSFEMGWVSCILGFSLWWGSKRIASRFKLVSP